MRQITDWLRIARHQFVLALDPIADQQTDPFIKQALRLVVDGIEAPQIRMVLESNIETLSTRRCWAPRCTRRWAAMRRPSASSAR